MKIEEQTTHKRSLLTYDEFKDIANIVSIYMNKPCYTESIATGHFSNRFADAYNEYLAHNKGSR